MSFDASLLRGTLHIFVAFDWGYQIHLEHARRPLPAESQDLARRPPTPSSIAYRPAPLSYPLPTLRLNLAELGAVQAAAETIVFDFGGASVSLKIPFQLTPPAIARLAGALADPQPLVDAAQNASRELFTELQPAIQQAAWSPLGEEYFVFQLPPAEQFPPSPELIEEHASWLVGLARLECQELSPTEIDSALQSRISYSPSDMLLAAWSASVLIDRDCEETLQAIEFANMQLLEYRFIDNLLDDRLAAAYSTIHRTLQSWLPFWRTHARPLRRLGELRIEANALFERASSALKLVGDPYLARVYRLIAERFHLAEWEKNVREALDVVEGAYQVVSDQSGAFRVEFLEVIVIVLIAIEILMAVFRR